MNVHFRSFTVCKIAATDVWAFNRVTEWWDVIVLGFSNIQWVKNCQMSKCPFICLCNKLCPVVGRQDTNSCGCVRLNKSGHCTVEACNQSQVQKYTLSTHLFGVSIMRVWRCVQLFTAAKEFQNKFASQKFEEMASYNENRYGLFQRVGSIDGLHMDPSWHHRSTILTGLTIKSETPSSFKVLWREKERSLHDAHFWDCQHCGSWPAIATSLQVAPGTLWGECRLLHPGRYCLSLAELCCIMKRKKCDMKLVNSMVLACCALQNLCKCHWEDYDKEWDASAAAGAAAKLGVPLSQSVEEEGMDVWNCLMHYLNR